MMPSRPSGNPVSGGRWSCVCPHGRQELPDAPKLFQKPFARILQRHRESENRRSKLSVPPRWPGRSLTGVHGNPAPKPHVEPALVIDVYASECLLACSITRPLSLCIPRRRVPVGNRG